MNLESVWHPRRLKHWTVAALCTLAPASALAGIESTLHDFSLVRQDQNLCAACHPPHVANGPQLPGNREPSTIAFRWSDLRETSGGTRLPTNVGSWLGSSRVCLACHDGTVDRRSFGSAGGGAVGLGHDLKGSHPIAIPYPYNRAKNTYNGIATGDAALKSGWVSAPRDVKLYSDPTAPAPNNQGIECASCHDPHGTRHAKFLRVSEFRGEICLRCHLK